MLECKWNLVDAMHNARPYGGNCKDTALTYVRSFTKSPAPQTDNIGPQTFGLSSGMPRSDRLTTALKSRRLGGGILACHGVETSINVAEVSAFSFSEDPTLRNIFLDSKLSIAERNCNPIPFMSEQAYQVPQASDSLPTTADRRTHQRQI
jgi:hypothetical protein